MSTQHRRADAVCGALGAASCDGETFVSVSAS